MNYKRYPETFWTHINTVLDSQKNSEKPLIAAFDADGTLWDTDLGENFFQYQIDHKLVELPHNAFDHYLDLKKLDTQNAFGWLAQINAGQKLTTVQQWADEAFQTIHPKPLFDEQKKLIHLLLENNVKVHIVTASITWAVQAGAKEFDLPIDSVIGVETEIIDGLISTTVCTPVTYRQGKVTGLLKKTNGIYPFLASGNTMGDFELLQSATDIRLAVSAASPDDPIYRTEKELQEQAKKLNWFNHRFI